MTINEFKKQHPDLYWQAYERGYQRAFGMLDRPKALVETIKAGDEKKRGDASQTRNEYLSKLEEVGDVAPTPYLGRLKRRYRQFYYYSMSGVGGLAYRKRSEKEVTNNTPRPH